MSSVAPLGMTTLLAAELVIPMVAILVPPVRVTDKSRAAPISSPPSVTVASVEAPVPL